MRHERRLKILARRLASRHRPVLMEEMTDGDLEQAVGIETPTNEELRQIITAGEGAPSNAKHPNTGHPLPTLTKSA